MCVIRFGMGMNATGMNATAEVHHWSRFRDERVPFYRGTKFTALTREMPTA